MRKMAMSDGSPPVGGVRAYWIGSVVAWIAGPERMPVITGHLSEAPFAIAYMGRPSPGWRQDVVLEYVPTSAYLALGISAAAWLALLAWVASRR